MTQPLDKDPPYTADPKQQEVLIDYTNWKGVRRERRILPKTNLLFCCNTYHPVMQWMIQATDLEDGVEKMWPLSNIHSWRPA